MADSAATRAEDRWTTALRQIVNVLGPETSGCDDMKCEGCAAEMAEALRIAKEALGVR